jgi:uncharacterized protein YndB with AHSA1/START domain
MEKQITIERVYGASPERIWKAWTTPEELKAWWGPQNVSIPECEVDLRVGGTFYIVMEAGEAMGEYKGTKWPMKAEFTTVEPHSKLEYTALAWTDGLKDETTIDQTTSIMFTEEDGKTKVTIIATILKVGPKAGMAVQGMEYGFNQQLDKLTQYLSS